MLPSPHTHQELPIACDMTRHLFGIAVQERQELSDGYAFRFDADQYGRLVAFLANERLCCPFFHFALEITPAQGPLWLRITGSDAVKAFIQSEFTPEE